MRLLAISDLHLGHRDNRAALEALPDQRDAWLILAGDVGERPEHLVTALDVLTDRFAQVIWTPGNHDLWCPPGTGRTAGQARYDELVAICRRYAVATPEDPFLVWPGDPATVVVPMFLLFDYSFRPPGVPHERALAWARETGVVSADERLLSADPWPSLPAWCHARCAATEARLDALPDPVQTILVNHWPLRYDLAVPPRIPRFSIWCGTTRTERWPQRYRARAVISGHLHLRTTLWRDGIRFEEVSLGYPRDWRSDRGIGWYLRDVLPDPGDEGRFVPARDPFRDAVSCRVHEEASRPRVDARLPGATRGRRRAGHRTRALEDRV
jgi:3',5'-cyclic AMP phosphodiesterase CpdA